jgi:NAD+ kinase
LRLSLAGDSGEYRAKQASKRFQVSEFTKISFCASRSAAAQASFASMTKRYGNVAPEEAHVIVALGGDGFMLSTLHETQELRAPVYGMHRGTVGFLMNDFSEDGLLKRLSKAEETITHPLRMQATRADGHVDIALAINEVSLLRSGPQAARLKISVDGKERMMELVCDGALVCTPAGSTAYNYSAHGPILPITADVLAITAMAAFRPRRWRGAILPNTAIVRFDVLDEEKRPVSATADNVETRNVVRVEIGLAHEISHRLLFDPGHGLEERLIREQFV